MEILSPAGGPEQLLAAVRSGANAVYLGTRGFNARRKATNFDRDELKQAVAYCHGRGVRVHVTVNTLVTDPELGDLYATMEEIAESGADAVILQDLAACELFRRHLPELPRHASTQMTVHNAQGALAAGELGFSRVILARELSLEEIRRIRAEVDIELECFVHGALCMGVSGQCLLSAMLGERSGNRGSCAQPCRLDFRAGDRPYALSLKDACLLEHVQALQEAGICSLKIEGRLRRPEYVAAATDACVRALRGETPDLKMLQRVFSRSGFTDGYLTGRRDLRMFGRRTEQDRAAEAAVLGQLSELYRRERSSVPVDMHLHLQPGEPVRLEVSDGVYSAAAVGPEPEAVRSQPPDVRASLEKTGGTPFFLNRLEGDIAPGWTARLNPLRREALEALLQQREALQPYRMQGSFTPEDRPPRQDRPGLRLRFEDRSQYFPCPEAEAVYMPAEQIDRELLDECGQRLIGELPRLLFPGDETALEAKLRELKEMGLRTLCAGNLGTLRLARELGFRVSGGFDLNILNSLALERYQELGLCETLLSCEIPIRQIPRLGGSIPRGILAYGYLPLMLMRSCPMRGPEGCGSCSGRRTLRDRQGTDMTVLCQSRRWSVLLNAVPLYLGDKGLRGMDFALLYFTTENREECRRVWQQFRAGESWEGKRTNGPYFRSMR